MYQELKTGYNDNIKIEEQEDNFMRYRSTRAVIKKQLTPASAIIKGLAPDGGLYVPTHFPKDYFKLEDLLRLSYKQISALIISIFFDDLSKNQIITAVQNAYSKQWDDRSIIPIRKHNNNFYLELFHGPTLSFKDISLQLLPQLLANAIQIENINQNIAILNVTSGDSGIATLRGFVNQKDKSVMSFYPESSVDSVQLRQLLSQNNDNLQAIAIKENFDDAQAEIKRLFNDEKLKMQLNKHDYMIFSANSINIASLIPQISYYLYTYGQLVRRREINLGDKINFSMPAGNFGNVIAAYYAKKLGLPIKKIICTSNENNVFTRFFKHGVYDKRKKLHLTNEPSMDILVSSNLERLLFELYDGDEKEITNLMNQLTQRGHYRINGKVLKKIQKNFVAGFATEREIIKEIGRVYSYNRYVIDPNTAAASYVAKQYQQQTGDSTIMAIVSTDSPYKFPEVVYEAITGRVCPQTGISAIKKLHEEIGGQLSIGVRSLFDHKPEVEKKIVSPNIELAIKEKLKLS